jgi:hypothetical protein
MKRKVITGDRVRIMCGSGIGSNKHGVVVSWDNPLACTVKVTYPFCGGRTPKSMGWLAVKLDGEVSITSYPEDRLIIM